MELCNLALLHRSYGGKIFRPKPYIHDEEHLLVVASCWGPGDQTQTIVSDVVKYVTAAMSDVEVTSHFEYLTCLSDQANNLRIAMLLANENIFRGENNTEFISGYELTIILKYQNQLSWAQVGGPHLLIRRQGQNLMPLTSQLDVSSEISGATILAPLPHWLLGLDSTCQVHCGDVKIKMVDQLVLTSSNYLSKALFTESAQPNLSLEKVTQMLIQENPDSPFWLGLLPLMD